MFWAVVGSGHDQVSLGHRVAIVGYGTAGQAAAIYLERAGHHVTVFEKASELGPVGAGLLLQPTGLSVLAELGLLDAAVRVGARVDALLGQTIAGRPVMDMRYGQLDASYYGLGIQRGALFELLRSAHAGRDRVQCGVAIVALDSDGRTLRDGRGQAHGPFDVIVAADGAQSVLRKSLLGARRDRPYPWGAVWTLCPDPGRQFDGALHQRYHRARYMAGVLPVGILPGQSSDDHRVSFFWSLPQAGFEAWQRRGLQAWKDEVASYWPEAGALLAGIQSPQQLARAHYSDVIVDRWYRGRVVFLGDAAHAMSPQLGQGANLALMDAQGLAQALDQSNGSIESAFRCYDARRRRHARVYQFISRWLTPLFQSEHDHVAALRDWAFMPVNRLWPMRPETLKVLAGVKNGWLGRIAIKLPDQSSGGT